MSTFFGFLFLVAIIGLIVGLIRPQLYGKIVGTKRPRMVSSILWGSIAFISMVIGAATMPPDKTTANTQTTQKAQPTSTAATTQPQSDTDAIKAAIQKDLEGTNDVGGNKFRNVDVVPQEKGGYGVFVDYNADEVGSHDSQMTLITGDMTKLYKTIYSDVHQDVRTASVSAYFAGTDQYANKVDKLTYKTILNSDVASKVNWGADEATLEISLPQLWSVTINTLGN